MSARQYHFSQIKMLITLKEACKILNCHPNTLRKWDKEGKLQAFRFGARGDRRYQRQDIINLLKKEVPILSDENDTSPRPDESVEYFRAIIESSNDAIISRTLDGIITSWNTAAERLFGYSATEVIGKHISLIMPSDRMDELERNVAKIKAGIKIYNSETVRLHKDGSLLDVSITVSPIHGASGGIIGASVIARDISEAKKMKLENQRSEKKLHLLLQNSSDIIGAYARDGTILYMSDSVERILGYPANERLGKNVFESIICHPGDLKIWKKMFRDSISNPGKNVVSEFRLIHQDGGLRWIEAVAVNLLDDQDIQAIVINSRDVTSRKKIERNLQKNIEKLRQYQHKLKTSKDQLDAILMSVAEGISVYTCDGKMLYVNESCAGILGFSSVRGMMALGDNETLYKEIENRFVVRGEDGNILPPENTTVARALRGELSPRLVLQFTDKKTGRKTWLQSSSHVVLDNGGKAEMIVHVLSDITNQKEVELRKDEFIKIASHELKTPVTTIKGYTEILKLFFGGQEKSIHYLSKMDSEIDRLTLLINDLFDVSKIQLGKLELRKEKCSIDELIKDVAEDMQHFGQQHDIILALKSNRKILSLDKHRIKQVMINLLSNAIKYSPVGSRIVVSTHIDHDKIWVSVQDNGLGIPKDDQKKIFDPFFQVNSDRRKSHSGLGLGLHITSEIVKRHGGEIFVESKIGKGSKFTFNLPLEN